ncbi:MAG: prolipoprotein diacylglyceryl transferase [Patescibacteria group bacterium]
MIPYFELTTINIGPLDIQFWGLMVALGFLVGILFLVHYSQKQGIASSKILDLGLWVILSSIVGSRLFYVINEWTYFTAHPIEMLYIWEGGLAWYGGMILALLAGYIFLRRNKLPMLKIMDGAVIGLAIGEAIGRIGCFFIHDHLGQPTNLPWGIEINGIVRHETALYSIVATLAIFVVLIITQRTERGKQTGRLTALYFLLYGITSFLIYQFRATDLPGSDPLWGALRPSQIFSVIAFLAGCWLLYQLKPSKENNIK